jgi:hypothetical protein
MSGKKKRLIERSRHLDSTDRGANGMYCQLQGELVGDVEEVAVVAEVVLGSVREAPMAAAAPERNRPAVSIPSTLAP